MLLRMTCGSVKIIVTTCLKGKHINCFSLYSVACTCIDASLLNSVLRMVPTRYKLGFWARLGPHGKLISLQGLLEFTRKNWG